MGLTKKIKERREISGKMPISNDRLEKVGYLNISKSGKSLTIKINGEFIGFVIPTSVQQILNGKIDYCNILKVKNSEDS